MTKILYVLTFIFLVPALAMADKDKDTVTTASGIKYVQLKAGKGEKPKDGSKVKVLFSGSFLNGEEFESNFGGSPFEFTVGKHEVIPGWEEAVKLMSKGEKAVFVIPAKLAYGKRGSKDDDGTVIIPPDTDLVFEIKLVDVD